MQGHSQKPDRLQFAHVHGDGSGRAPHLLEEHLREVARLAAESAAPFGGETWAFLAGLWHDLGKYRPAFQAKLLAADGVDAHVENGLRVTHSNAGALHAMKMLGPAKGRVLAFLIAGHHAGLADFETADGAAASLKARLESPDSAQEYREALAQAVPADILAPRAVQAPATGKDGFALWLRMLFSCLVDADFLDTERFFDPAKAGIRGQQPPLRKMKEALDHHMAEMTARTAAAPSAVNQKRAEVLAACREKAALPPGIFSLTVPTGGGKTLSSLSFALDHALAHGKRRIVYAIPYTSIIEQTAEVFRLVFADCGEGAVLEHHSNLDVDPRRENHASRLAAENWDAPLIVTTNVQLFESLHAARTSRCRKLHNLAGSVIVLDEAQLLPRDFLAPVVLALKLLVRDYGVTLVLCTATQPALNSRFDPFGRRVLDGLEEVREIIDEPLSLFAALKRVEVHFPADFRARSRWEELAAAMAAEPGVLAIVNTRRDARDLHRLMPPGTKHLSALMCAQHRSRVIGEIKIELREGRPVRAVSTQLVEAGVDVDFPVVYRALAGMDSIAQAAGRCNREGRLGGPGQVHVFVAPGAAPPGLLRQGEQTTRELSAAGKLRDPLAPATFTAYFDQLYAKGGLDREGILELLLPERSAFRTAAQKFRLIDDEAETVIVPYRPEPTEESPVLQWLNVLRRDGNATWARRKLQRYTVNVPRKPFEQMVRQGDLEERAGLWVALPSRYDAVLGLLLPDDHGKPDDFFF